MEEPDAVQGAALAPSRGRLVGGDTVVRAVHWPAASEVDGEAVAALPDAARRSLEDAPVPVLAPTDPELLSAAVVTHGARWAAVSMKAAGLHVNLQVSGQAKVYSHIEPVAGTHTIRGIDGFVTHNEGVWVASWIEHGAAYSLELECASLKADACRDPEHLMSLTDTLTFVGGRAEAHQ